MCVRESYYNDAWVRRLLQMQAVLVAGQSKESTDSRVATPTYVSFGGEVARPACRGGDSVGGECSVVVVVVAVAAAAAGMPIGRETAAPPPAPPVAGAPAAVAPMPPCSTALSPMPPAVPVAGAAISISSGRSSSSIAAKKLCGWCGLW